MPDCLSRTDLERLYAGETPAAESARVREHLAGHARCPALNVAMVDASLSTVEGEL